MKKSSMTALSILSLALISNLNAQTTQTYDGCGIYTVTDPVTSNAVDLPDPQRSVFVDAFSNFEIDPVSGNEVATDYVFNGLPRVPILCKGAFLPAFSLFQKEKDFLDEFTAGISSNPAEPDFQRLVLYRITNDVLPNANKQVKSDGQPMGASVNSVEAHLARFIYVARHTYDLDLEAIINSNSMSQGATNTVNVYNLNIDISTFEQTITQFHANGADPCLNQPNFTTGKTSSLPPGYWDYFKDVPSNLIFPKDSNGVLHPLDEMRKGIWNLRVFQEKYPSIIASIASSFQNIDPFDPECGFDRVMVYNEFWIDKSNPTSFRLPGFNSNLTYDITQDWEAFKLALDYANCTTTQLEEGCAYKVDSWLGRFSSTPNPGSTADVYLVQDGNGIFYDPQTTNINENMALEVEQKSDEIFLAAYKKNPCKAYSSSGASTMRTNEYVYQQMELNSIVTPVAPTFITLPAPGVGSQNLDIFLNLRVANGDSFDGTMGKAESTYRSYHNAASHQDPIENFAWFHRTGIENGNFFKSSSSTGVEETEHKSINFYPNPVQNELRFKNPEELAGKAYAITDLSGRVVQQGVINGPISTSQLASGMFLFQLEGNQIEKFQKID